jgi:hypothetical protein
VLTGIKELTLIIQLSTVLSIDIILLKALVQFFDPGSGSTTNG